MTNYMLCIFILKIYGFAHAH